MKPVFIIGDVHGHHDRLQALLDKAGATTDFDRIQVGDLGQFDRDSQKNDLITHKLALDLGLIVLWGNHDFATINEREHGFRGLYWPTPELRELRDRLRHRFAYAAGEWLITHAGLHPNATPIVDGRDARECANIINSMDVHLAPIRNIPASRRGLDAYGGILWRDEREPLYENIPQIFGHTRGYTRWDRKNKKSVCIDTGGKSDGNLTGIWLPEMRLVSIGPDAAINEIGENAPL